MKEKFDGPIDRPSPYDTLEAWERHLAQVEGLDIDPASKERLVENAKAEVSIRKAAKDHGVRVLYAGPFWPPEPGRKVVWPPEGPGLFDPPEKWEQHLKLLQDAEFEDEELKELLIEDAKEMISKNRTRYDDLQRKERNRD